MLPFRSAFCHFYYAACPRPPLNLRKLLFPGPSLLDVSATLPPRIRFKGVAGNKRTCITCFDKAAASIPGAIWYSVDVDVSLLCSRETRFEPRFSPLRGKFSRRCDRIGRSSLYRSRNARKNVPIRATVMIIPTENHRREEKSMRSCEKRRETARQVARRSLHRYYLRLGEKLAHRDPIVDEKAASNGGFNLQENRLAALIAFHFPECLIGRKRMPIFHLYRPILFLKCGRGTFWTR